MSLPETCPFCGAGVFANFCGQNGWKENWVAYECHTWIFMDRDRANNQSNLCIASERTRLAARVAELEEANRSNRVVMGGLSAVVDAWKDHCKRLEEAGDNMLEALYTPEPPRCMCHRSPPCDDCVNYALARDAKQKWQQAKEAKP